MLRVCLMVMIVGVMSLFFVSCFLDDDDYIGACVEASVLDHVFCRNDVDGNSCNTLDIPDSDKITGFYDDRTCDSLGYTVRCGPNHYVADASDCD